MGGWMRASNNSFRGGRIDPVAGRPSSPKVSTDLLMGLGGLLTVRSIDSFLPKKRRLGEHNRAKLHVWCALFTGRERPATRFCEVLQPP